MNPVSVFGSDSLDLDESPTVHPKIVGTENLQPDRRTVKEQVMQ